MKQIQFWHAINFKSSTGSFARVRTIVLEMRGLFVAKSDGKSMLTSLEKILIFGEEREEEK